MSPTIFGLTESGSSRSPYRTGWLRAGYTSKSPGRGAAGRVTKAQVREIATAKLKDLNAIDVEAAMRMVEGSARSMGIEVAE